jgi:DNA-binding CsgD family transcriptional regulator
MGSTTNRPEVFRRLHRELLRRAQATGTPTPEWTDESGSVVFRSADIGGHQVLVVSLAAPLQDLISESELGQILRMSPRKTTVARLLARRRTNPEIADELNISQSTVRRHAEYVFLRLGVNSRRDVDEAIRERVLGALYPRSPARLQRRTTTSA